MATWRAGRVRARDGECGDECLRGASWGYSEEGPSPTAGDWVLNCGPWWQYLVLHLPLYEFLCILSNKRKTYLDARYKKENPAYYLPMTAEN
jgi:hypothetical protein